MAQMGVRRGRECRLSLAGHDLSSRVFAGSVQLYGDGVGLVGQPACEHQRETRIGSGIEIERIHWEKIGIQLLGDFHDTQLQGTNNFEYIHLRFSYKPYPDFQPRIIHMDDWFSMKDTEGYLKQKTFSLNMLARFPLAHWINLDVSGGASLFLYSGKAEPIGYIHHIFAHDIFVTHPYRYDFSIPATTTLGANIGEELNIALGRHLILFASCRYYRSFGGSSEIKLTSKLFQSAPQDEEELRIIEQRLNLGPLKLKPSFFSMKIGVGFGF